MRTFRRIATIVAVACAVLVAGAIVYFAITYEERTFHLERIEVEAQVLRDHSMLVRERVTYRFQGADDDPFSVGSRSWDADYRRPWRIEDVTVTEDGRPKRTIHSGPLLHEWDLFPGTNGTRTFELTYRVVDAVQVWEDTAELYWNWIGRNQPAVGEWSAVIRLPHPHDEEVRAWAHGPLNGVIRIESDRVVSAVDEVPEGQFVDNRILMPVEWFDGPPIPERALDDILDEEARNARNANLQREEWERNEARKATARRALNAAMAPLIIAGFGGFYWVWRRWGKDPERPTDIGEYWREVPDDPPAVGAALLGWRSVDGHAYAATVMDLARRGYLRIEEIEVERRILKPRLSYRFERTDKNDQLEAFERRLLNWIFPGTARSVTQDELIARATADRERAHKFWQGFQKDVTHALDRRDYIVRGKGLAFTIHFAICAVLLAAGIAALVLGAIVAGVAGVAAAVILAPLGVLHRSRTPAGTRRHAEWKGLRAYLEDFSSLGEAPMGHLALWEQYLVAATALGVADKLIEGLRVRFPEQADQALSQTAWYATMRSTDRPMGEGFAAFGSTFGSASVSSFSPPSSGGGAGGGFSSGGGGGGGGGGFGAR
jgi:uncharacterized membrane protein